jgi:hypothetical protein
MPVQVHRVSAALDTPPSEARNNPRLQKTLEFGRHDSSQHTAVFSVVARSGAAPSALPVPIFAPSDKSSGKDAEGTETGEPQEQGDGSSTLDELSPEEDEYTDVHAILDAAQLAINSRPLPVSPAGTTSTAAEGDDASCGHEVPRTNSEGSHTDTHATSVVADSVSDSGAGQK